MCMYVCMCGWAGSGGGETRVVQHWPGDAAVASGDLQRSGNAQVYRYAALVR